MVRCYIETKPQRLLSTDQICMSSEGEMKFCVFLAGNIYNSCIYCGSQLTDKAELNMVDKKDVEESRKSLQQR